MLGADVSGTQDRPAGVAMERVLGVSLNGWCPHEFVSRLHTSSQRPVSLSHPRDSVFSCGKWGGASCLLRTQAKIR